MYRITGSWAGYTLYIVDGLTSEEAVDEAIGLMSKRFLEGDYRLPQCLHGTNIVPEVLCITAVKVSDQSHNRIVRRVDVK